MENCNLCEQRKTSYYTIHSDEFKTRLEVEHICDLTNEILIVDEIGNCINPNNGCVYTRIENME
jgi:hypothetical protein